MKQKKLKWQSLVRRVSLATLAFSLFTGTLSAQEADSTIEEKVLSPDTTRISWGKTKIIIIEHVEEKEKDTTKKIKQRNNHFAGLDLGINGFLSESNSVDLGKDERFMDLNYRKSISVALNFWEWYIPIAKEKFGVTTGAGFEFNSYDLDRSVDIVSTKDTTFGVQAAASKDIEKNRFKATMLNVPLMLETNLGKDADHSFHLALGGMLSYRVGSKVKQIYEEADKEYKVKNRNDYNMNDFRFNAIARIGYGNLTLFASYSFTPMFEDNKGPELYPFTVGISLVSF
jgi:hypothetical protein